MYHVSKRYPNGVDALTDVDVIIEAGEFCFLSNFDQAGQAVDRFPLLQRF